MRLFFHIMFMTLIFTSSAFGGDGKGHGGDIIQCTDVSQPSHNTSLDYYESIYVYNRTIITTHDDEIEMARIAISRLQSLDIHRTNELLKDLETFYQDIKWANFPLVNIRDTGETNIPENCKLVQIINQNKRLLRGNKKYIVNKKLWSQIDTLNKAMLIVHELLYLYSEPKESNQIRNFNSLLFSDKVKDLTLVEYWNFLFKNKFKTLSYSGTNLLINPSMIFYKEGFIREAYPNEGSTLNKFSQNFILTHDKVHFYTNGALKSFCSKDLLSFNIMNTELKGKCANTFGYYIPIELYSNGKIKSLSIFNQKIENQFYYLELGSTLHRRELFSKVTFSKDNQQVQVSSPHLILKKYIPNIFFDNLKLLTIINQKVYFESIDKFFDPQSKLWLSGNIIVDNGKIIQTHLAQTIDINIGPYQLNLLEGSELKLFSSGKLKSVKLLQDTDLILENNETIFFKKNTVISFNEEGDLL